MELKMQKWGSGLVVGLFFIALVIGGCAKGDKGSLSISDPSAVNFQPKGTIQGKVRDADTNEPIANVVVSVGLATDVTDAQGQYILANIPATTDALNESVYGQYDLTIDLRSAVSPVNMNNPATTPRYPDFSYKNVSVSYTSLNDSSPCPDSPTADNDELSDCGTNNSNHDTPVDGLVANADAFVGKQDASIKGVVLGGCTLSGSPDYYALKAGYTVNLLSTGSDNSATGNYGHLIQSVTTGDGTTAPLGEFTFTNVEANQSFTIQVMDSATNPTLDREVSVSSPGDNQTNTDYLEPSNGIHVCATDDHGPTIISVTPEEGSDLAENANETVTLAFSEPVVQTAQTTDDPVAINAPGGLIGSGNLEVEFDGNKGNGIPFTAQWNTTFDQLTISFATATSSLYHVAINNVGLFKDSAGNFGFNGACPDSTPGSWPVSVSAGTNGCVVFFSTNGGATPGTTPNLTVVNALSLNYGVTNVVLDWPVISGAKSYNLYCEQDQVYQDGTSQAGTLQFVTNVQSSQHTLNVAALGGFVELFGYEVSLQYFCMVRGYNSDGVEGADSNVVSVKDAVGPDFTANGTNGSPTVTVNYTEPVKEAEAKTLGNYALSGTDAALTLQSVTYNTATWQATLTYSGNITDDINDTLTITNVVDLAGNANLTTPAGNNQDTL